MGDGIRGRWPCAQRWWLLSDVISGLITEIKQKFTKFECSQMKSRLKKSKKITSSSLSLILSNICVLPVSQ